MSEDKFYVQVPSRLGEKTRRILLETDLLHREFRIVSSEESLFFPLSRDIDEKDITALLGDIEFTSGRMIFEPITTGPRSLEEALSDQLTPEELALLPRAYDLIGDIAVLELPDGLKSHGAIIGAAFVDLHPNFTTVLAKCGAISGTVRVRSYELLAGEDKTHTVHTEYGCKIAVDLAKAYFSPRLLEEHNRIATLVRSGESVIDMFTGVGPFAIHIAKRTDATIAAIDINPAAIELLKESIGLNKIIGTILPVVADAGVYVSSNYNMTVNRVIMNHPSGASEFVKGACKALRPGGVIHYYDFMGGENPEDELTKKVRILVEQAGRKIKEISTIRRVRDSAPYEFQMVIDVILQ